ncbi:MAG: hypothetical protein QXE45_04545 [Thermoplasmata archaeon]
MTKLLFVDSETEMFAMEDAYTEICQRFPFLESVYGQWPKRPNEILEVCTDLGILTNSAIGYSLVAEFFFGRRVKPGEYLHTEITNCLQKKVPTDYKVIEMPIQSAYYHLQVRAERRHKKITESMYREVSLAEARRLCFQLKNHKKPGYVYFAKGTARVMTPNNAVARIGSSESDEVIFLDHFARPISAWCAKQDGPIVWAEPDRIPEKLDYRQLRPLGKSTVDIIFGVRG